jgi:hypothetical protein
MAIRALRATGPSTALNRVANMNGRGSLSSTFQLNLSRF